MSENTTNEAMLEMYLFETTQLIEKLEQLVIEGEKTSGFKDSINEIFRIMHTIKGSSAMMFFNNIAELSHAVEDLFFYLRENPESADYRWVGDHVLDAVDFIKNELSKIIEGETADGDSADQIATIKAFLKERKGSGGATGTAQKNKTETGSQARNSIAHNIKKIDGFNKQEYEANVFFSNGCEMEDVRAYGVINKLSRIADIINYDPENISGDDEGVVEQIRKKGFKIGFYSSLPINDLRTHFEKTVFLEKLELNICSEAELLPLEKNRNAAKNNKAATFSDETKQPAGEVTTALKTNEPVLQEKGNNKVVNNQGVISVTISKTDNLMNLMGEMIIAEAMVTQNPDLRGLKLANFQKAARQLRKITHEMQDAVMSIRMVPLAATFLKMHRIVRDMGKKMDKEVVLEVIGEETEVDKNIIEHISDPLMHLVRNAIDHGIEGAGDRTVKNKPKTGVITLEARNAGSDVLVIVRDDGKGLHKEKILQTARAKGLLRKPETEMNDQEIFNLIFLPGFSTKDQVTEFSGRGVGMDVVTKNIEMVGGSVSVDSVEDAGTTVILKIPLTLAIIDGMNIMVGDSRFTLPTIAIKESFRPKEKDIIKDLDGHEMIMVRGQCFPILRLHEHFGVPTNITDFSAGILIMVEQNEKSYCIFADKLLGQQQVVVKSLPKYIKNLKRIGGLAGCTLLGEGSISLILEIGGLINTGGSS